MTRLRTCPYTRLHTCLYTCRCTLLCTALSATAEKREQRLNENIAACSADRDALADELATTKRQLSNVCSVGLSSGGLSSGGLARVGLSSVGLSSVG